MVVIDTMDDTLARFDVDDRCGGVTQTIETESGDAYFASSALAVAAFDEELAEVSDLNATWELTGQAAWRWWA